MDRIGRLGIGCCLRDVRHLGSTIPRLNSPTAQTTHHTACASLRHFAALIPPLARRHRVVAFDAFGCGRSPKPDYAADAYATEELFEDLLEVYRRYKVRRRAVYGCIRVYEQGRREKKRNTQMPDLFMSSSLPHTMNEEHPPHTPSHTSTFLHTQKQGRRNLLVGHSFGSSQVMRLAAHIEAEEAAAKAAAIRPKGVTEEEAATRPPAATAKGKTRGASEILGLVLLASAYHVPDGGNPIFALPLPVLTLLKPVISQV